MSDDDDRAGGAFAVVGYIAIILLLAIYGSAILVPLLRDHLP